MPLCTGSESAVHAIERAGAGKSLCVCPPRAEIYRRDEMAQAHSNGFSIDRNLCTSVLAQHRTPLWGTTHWQSCRLVILRNWIFPRGPSSVSRRALHLYSQQIVRGGSKPQFTSCTAAWTSHTPRMHTVTAHRARNPRKCQHLKTSENRRGMETSRQPVSTPVGTSGSSSYSRCKQA